MVSVEISGLVKRYAGHAAIDHVDLTVESGSFVTLLGPSGCGKTTTLRSLAGLEQPDEGRIQVGDRVFVDAGRNVFVPPERRNIGMVFQSYALWPHMTVEQNVAYPLKRQRWKSAAIDAEVGRLLDLVGLAPYRERSVSALSGGQQQRVALARAMVGTPVLALFDEPLSNLDVKLRDRMRTEIRRLHDKIGMTSVYVTHDQSEAFALSDVVVVMNAGRIQQTGTPRDIYARPANAFVANFVGFENRTAATAVSARGDKVRVAFDGGAELDVVAEGLSAGDAVEVFSRPTGVRFSDAPGHTKLTEGRVTDVTYFGDAFELHVESPLGVFRGREVADGDRAPFAVGATVPVHLENRSAVVLPAETD